MFDGQLGIALHAMQGNRASSRSEGEVSRFFSRCGGNLGYILELHRDGPSKLVLVQLGQDSCLVLRDTAGFSLMLGRAMGMPLEVRWETKYPFPVATVILGFLSIFKRSQTSSPFEALKSTCLSRFQRDMRRPVELRQGPRTFSGVSTGDSDIPSSSDMIDEPAFKPLQGNLAFFRVRASRCPFHLRQQTQGPSHIPIAERSLLLRCLCKVGIPLESNPGNQLSS